MKPTKKIAILFSVLICAVSIVWFAKFARSSETSYTYSEFLNLVRGGKIASVVVNEGAIGGVDASCTLKSGKSARIVLPANHNDALRAMLATQVDVQIRRAPSRVLLNAAPFLVLLTLWAVLMAVKFPRPTNLIG